MNEENTKTKPPEQTCNGSTDAFRTTAQAHASKTEGII
jgi:hypothetical protein